MKILKYALFGVALFIVVLLLIGLFRPNFSYENQITVNKPVETAFAVFSNPERLGAWMTGLKSFKILSGQVNQVGSIYRFVFSVEDEEITITETITGFEKNKRFAFHLEADVLETDTEILFSPLETGCEIYSRNIVEPKGIFRKSIFPFFKGTFQTQSQAQYNKLRSLIEAVPDSLYL